MSHIDPFQLSQAELQQLLYPSSVHNQLTAPNPPPSPSPAPSPLIPPQPLPFDPAPPPASTPVPSDQGDADLALFTYLGYTSAGGQGYGMADPGGMANPSGMADRSDSQRSSSDAEIWSQALLPNQATLGDHTAQDSPGVRGQTWQGNAAVGRQSVQGGDSPCGQSLWGSRRSDGAGLQGNMPFAGQSLQGSMPFGGQSQQGSMPFSGQSLQDSRHFDRQGLQGSRPFHGGGLQGGMPFDGHSLQGSMPFNEQSPQNSMPFDGLSMPGSASLDGHPLKDTAYAHGHSLQSQAQGNALVDSLPPPISGGSQFLQHSVLPQDQYLHVSSPHRFDGQSVHARAPFKFGSPLLRDRSQYSIPHIAGHPTPRMIPVGGHHQQGSNPVGPISTNSCPSHVAEPPLSSPIASGQTPFADPSLQVSPSLGGQSPQERVLFHGQSVPTGQRSPRARRRQGSGRVIMQARTLSGSSSLGSHQPTSPLLGGVPHTPLISHQASQQGVQLGMHTSGEEPARKPAEKLLGTSLEKPLRKPDIQPAERPTGQSVEKPLGVSDIQLAEGSEGKPAGTPPRGSDPPAMLSEPGGAPPFHAVRPPTCLRADLEKDYGAADVLQLLSQLADLHVEHRSAFSVDSVVACDAAHE